MRRRAGRTAAILASLLAVTTMPSAAAPDPLYVAIEAGDVAAVERRLAAGDRPEATPGRWSSLHVAASGNTAGHVAIVRLLLARGPDVDFRGPDGLTPLHVAAQRGNVAAVDALLLAGADATRRNDDGATPLWLSVTDSSDDLERRARQPATALRLMRVSSDLTATDRYGQTLLHAAAANLTPAVAEALLAAKLDPNARDRGNGSVGWRGAETALHRAVRRRDDDGRQAMVRTLLAHGADANAADADGVTLLHAAAFTGDVVVVRLLLDHGAGVGAKTRRGETPLHLAVQAPAVAALLMERGAPAPEPAADGRLPLHAAANLALVDEYLRAGVPIDSRDAAGRTLLHYAAERGAALVAGVLERGADPRARDACGLTPLHVAALAGDVATAERLLSAGADVDAASTAACQWTPDFVSPDAGIVETLPAGATPRDLAAARHDESKWVTGRYRVFEEWIAERGGSRKLSWWGRLRRAVGGR